MAQQTEAEKAEEARRKGLTKEQRAEEDRRAALSPEARDAEDKKREADEAAELEALDREIAEENEARGLPARDGRSAAQRRAELQKKIADRDHADYLDQATEEVTVARGRSVVSGPPHAQVENVQGMTLNVTPQEALKLRASGHVVRPDGNVAPEAGPRVYQEAGLIQGHGTGQGTKSK